MSIFNLAQTAVGATPGAATTNIYADNGPGSPAFKNGAGRAGLMVGGSFNAAIAAVAGYAADTYVTDSDLLIPSFGLQARSFFRWQISASKTGAGIATPTYIIRMGSGRTTSDTAILTLTGPAQTAIADVGTLNVIAVVRSIGAGSAAVIQATAWWDHRGTAANTTTSGTGFANDSTGHVEGTSSGFDSTAMAGKYIALSLNGGASAAWTTTLAIAEAMW